MTSDKKFMDDEKTIDDRVQTLEKEVIQIRNTLAWLEAEIEMLR